MPTPEGLGNIPQELLAKIPTAEADSSFFQDLYLISSEIRRSAFNTILIAGSGHLGASSSSVEMLTSLYFGGVLKYDPNNPNHPDRDRVMLRGHLGPARYKIFSLLGWISESSLDHYRQLGGLPGHEEMHEVPGVDITPTGSLGMELSYGAGIAYAAKRMGKDFKSFVFLGDGEEQEGNVSEAARHIAIMGLDNIICIIDKNGKQLSGPTSNIDNLNQIWEGYGWDVREIADGNDIVEVQKVLKKAREDSNGKPILVISNTVKGLGVPSSIENFCGHHTVSTCSKENLQAGIDIQNRIMAELDHTPEQVKSLATQYASKNTLKSSKEQDGSTLTVNIQPHPEYSGDLKKGLEHYRRELVELLRTNPDTTFYSMTADLMRMDLVKMYNYDKPPVIHIDTGIREQHLIAMAYGLSLTDPSSRILINFAELTAYRAADQISVVSIGKGRMIILSEGGGLSSCRDGATHESTSIPGMILTMPGIETREPADVLDAYNSLNKALTEDIGPYYIRTHWRKTPLLPRAEKDLNSTTYYQVGESSEHPDLVLVSCGLTTQGALEAKILLKEKYGLDARLINVIDLKSLDKNFVELLEPGVPVMTIYNGVEAILRYAVATAIMKDPINMPTNVVGHGFVRGATGLLDDLIKEFKFDGDGIVEVLHEKLPNIFN